MCHEQALDWLEHYWSDGGGEEAVNQEWAVGLDRRAQPDFFWKTLFEGAMVDGDAVGQPIRAQEHPSFETLTDFTDILVLLETNQYIPLLQAFLAPQALGGMGHRWGQAPNGRIYEFLENAPHRIVDAFNTVEAAGNGLLALDFLEDAKTYISPVIPENWPKTQANFLMMLSLDCSQNTMAVDVRIKNIATAWAGCLEIQLNTNDHPAVVAFFTEHVLLPLNDREIGIDNLWKLDRLLFMAYRPRAEDLFAILNA